MNKIKIKYKTKNVQKIIELKRKKKNRTNKKKEQAKKLIKEKNIKRIMETYK